MCVLSCMTQSLVMDIKCAVNVFLIYSKCCAFIIQLVRRCSSLITFEYAHIFYLYVWLMLRYTQRMWWKKNLKFNSLLFVCLFFSGWVADFVKAILFLTDLIFSLISRDINRSLVIKKPDTWAQVYFQEAVVSTKVLMAGLYRSCPMRTSSLSLSLAVCARVL